MLFEVLQGMPRHVHHIVSPVLETQGSWIIICHMLLYLHSLLQLFYFCLIMTSRRWETVKIYSFRPLLVILEHFPHCVICYFVICLFLTRFPLGQFNIFDFVDAWECAPGGTLEWSVANKPGFMSKAFLFWIIHDPHINSTPDSQTSILARPRHDACLYHSSEHHHGWASLWVPNPLFVT